MTTAPAPTSATHRILSVMRLQVANPWTTLILPWLILAVIFAGNISIWWLILNNLDSSADRADVAEGLQFSGASMYIFVHMMIVAVQAINVTFPFALGYGVTRRDYYLGTAATFVALSAMYSIGLTIMSVLEEATGGWGLGGRMFTAVYFGDGGWPQRLFIFFTTFMFCFFVGSVAAAIWVRWKANGLTVFFVALGLLVVGGIALLTVTSGWVAFGNFFVASGWLGSFAWSLVPTAIAAITGYFILQRATPRS